MLHRVGSEPRRLIDVSKMPQRPGQITEHSRSDVLAIPVSEGRMVLRIVKCAGALKVLACGVELSHRNIGAPEQAVRKTQRCRMAIPLGLRKEFGSRPLQHIAFAPDIIACP